MPLVAILVLKLILIYAVPLAGVADKSSMVSLVVKKRIYTSAE